MFQKVFNPKVGLINLYAIESPGMTSSLAIGDYIVEMLQEGFVIGYYKDRFWGI